jgi:hypothetical protein
MNIFEQIGFSKRQAKALVARAVLLSAILKKAKALGFSNKQLWRYAESLKGYNLRELKQVLGPKLKKRKKNVQGIQ